MTFGEAIKRYGFNEAAKMLGKRKPPVVVCAWCPDAKEKEAAAHAAGRIVTHGICPACAKLADPRD